MFKIILVALVVTVVGLFVMSKIDPNNQPSNIVNVSNTLVVGGDGVKVGISGQILHPGTYDISPQNTLGDLINLAGGTLENADPDSYVSGLVIGSRTSFYIPKKAEIPDTCIIENIEKVNVNSADETALKGVGFTSSQATALISYRDTNGSFQALEDIMKVSGIGEKTYLSVRDKISLS